MNRTVVVTDGDERAALAVVRSLGRAGHRVHVGAARRRSLAGSSRYCAHEFPTPDPMRDADGFARALAMECERSGAQVALPVTEAALLAVLPRRERVAARIPFPEAADFARLCDKAEVLRAAARHGIAVPRQRIIADRTEVDAAASEACYPLVLKPTRSVVGAEGARAKTSVAYADDEAQLREIVRHLPDSAFPVLQQQRIRGHGAAVSVLMWDGEVRAAFAHRRLREKPPSGGVSTLRESIPLDPALLARSVDLLSDFAWRGVAMVEYKVDARSGTPYLMEVNGRLWGSLQLAIDAGVDIPALLVEAAMGVLAPPVTTYAAVRTWWELGDFDHLLTRLRRSAAALDLSPGSPARIAVLGGFLRALGPGTRSEVMRWDDPKPFLAESRRWLTGQ